MEAPYESGIDVTSALRILECIVVTPEATALETPAQFVALPMFDGEVGVAPGHAPFIGRLSFGEMRVNEGNSVRRFYIDGGFVQVVNNTVSVLTNRAVPADQVSADVAEEQLRTALAQPANSPELLAKRDRLQAQARAQIRVAQRGR